MLDFLLENWKVLTVLLLDLIILIFSIIRRVKVVDSPLTRVLSDLPTFIKSVEASLGAGRGEEKLDLVLRMAKSLLVAYGCSDPDNYIDVIRAQIEEILSTPQKK